MKTFREYIDIMNESVAESQDFGGFELVDQSEYDVTVRMPTRTWQHILELIKSDNSVSEEASPDAIARVEQIASKK